MNRLFIFGLAGIALVMLVGVLPFLVPGRFSLQMFAVLAAETALAALLGLALCRATGRYRLLAGLLLGGAVLRFAVNAVGGHFQPVAQSGVGAFLLAAALPALPALQDYHFPALGGEGRALLRKLLRPLLATTGVLGALALFTDAHRFVAQANFGFADPNLNGFVDLPGFDDFQVAGFLARGVLLLTLPPLLIFAARRAGVDRTTRESLNWFWIYLVALFTGVVLLVAAAPLADVVFTGHAGAFLRGFAAPVFVLGLVQGMGAFVLASRRWIECLVFSGAGVAYALFLYAAGHQPAVLMSCMFGGALIALMLVLAVGVVRYGRSHP